MEERLAEQEWLVHGEVGTAGVARVWVSPDRARWLREERTVTDELADGAVVVELPYGSTDWLVREVLKGVGDLVVLEHWAQSGFANTDLDAQLNQRGIEKIILVGMIANTCIESTARFGMELGYHVTLIRDATAARDEAGMHAALEVNGPRYAHAILTTDELLAQLPS